MPSTPNPRPRLVSFLIHMDGAVEYEWLRPEAFTALDGSDFIIHAGDIGKPDVLTQLETLTPGIAVKGNKHRGPWAESLSATQSTTIPT